jgi:GNAT superfamily N-acetyltransferase
MPLTMRSASPGDHSDLAELFHGLNRHEEPISQDRRTDYQGAIESLDAAWRLVRETNGHALVAEQDGRVVGFLFLVFKQDGVLVREDMRPYAYVSELFVRAEMRGSGVGTALIAEAERLAIAHGFNRLMIGVLAGNTQAEALYLHLGFAPYSLELAKPIGPH